MLLEEASWLSRAISRIDPEVLFPMCNIGSNTYDYRVKSQPWIDTILFASLQRHGYKIIHQDIRLGIGIDVRGDATDPAMVTRLSGMGIKSILCSNVLECVTNPQTMANMISTLLPPDGYAFVTCPYSYPVHYDPIDNRCRPDVGELASLFPGLTLEYGEIVTGRTYLDDLAARGLVGIAKTAVRLLMPFYRPWGWRTEWGQLAWLFRNYQVTCAVFRKSYAVADQ